jgi:hemerythrin
MRITWTTDLETGIRSIDRQHQELIGMINALTAAHEAGGDWSVLDEVMQGLGAYVVFHFGTEAALMADLPQEAAHTAAHLCQHADFIAQFERMRAEAQGGDHAVGVAMIDFLNAWLYEHILKTDRSLGTLVRQHMAAMHETATTGHRT